jgi:hypothetical protein
MIIENRGIRMLKIKDNVDLKELEKFGFEKDGYDYYYDFIPYNEDNSNGQYICADIKTRKIYLDYIDLDYFNKSAELLYDLIKADLVEKVEEE